MATRFNFLFMHYEINSRKRTLSIPLNKIGLNALTTGAEFACRVFAEIYKI